MSKTDFFTKRSVLLAALCTTVIALPSAAHARIAGDEADKVDGDPVSEQAEALEASDGAAKARQVVVQGVAADPVADQAAALASGSAHGEIYLPEEFVRFSPRNARNMLDEIPGFSIKGGGGVFGGGGGGRGLGQASSNVLINGQRMTSKSDNVANQLSRITIDKVVRIEIVDGGSLDMPGLSGQVANVITRAGGVTGQFRYQIQARPKGTKPSYLGGEVSLSGSTSQLEWTVAYRHNSGRGAASGPAFITDAAGDLLENRDVYFHFEGEFPRLSGNLKWQSAGGTIANFNTNYGRRYTDFSNDEVRDLVTGLDLFRDFDNLGRGYNYEIGGDIDFAFGPGRLKLIALESFNQNRGQADSSFVYVDSSPTTGSRYASLTDTGERIGRAEYRWEMLGGNWQIDAEAAFNRLAQSSQLFSLDTNGDLVEIVFPGGTGGVIEDRFEVILTHGRTLAPGLTMQLGIGGEYSTLVQTGSDGLTRSFQRPKGSLTLAWAANKDLALSLKVARSVGQLSFGDFLAGVNLQQENQNSGNTELVPSQNWSVDFEAKKALGAWGSTTLKLFTFQHEDYVALIPQIGGGEGRGNVPTAQLYGISWNSTLNLDQTGFNGAKINSQLSYEKTSILDPLTGSTRSFSGHQDVRVNIDLRHDLPGSDWAWGAGLIYNHKLAQYRLSEVTYDYEGPFNSFAFVEHKDVMGLTVNLQVFNLFGAKANYDRTVYNGARNSSTVNYRDVHRLDMSPNIRLQIRGSF